MTEWMNNLLMLVILLVYCRILVSLIFAGSQILILIVECIADLIERREGRRALQQVKTVSYRKGLDRKRTFDIERNWHRIDISSGAREAHHKREAG